MARIIRTDDAAQRAEFVWLGPVESPWPFHARGTAWVLALVVCPIAVVAVYGLVPVWAVAPGPVGHILHLLTSGILGMALGVLLVRNLGRRLTPTTPLRHHAAIAVAEREAPRTAAVAVISLGIGDDVFLTDAAPASRRSKR